MTIQENIPLAEHTTFKIGGPARFFCRVSDEDELIKAVRFATEKKIDFFVLGGGSNLLISDNGFGGLVIKNEIKGIKYVDDRVIASAGEMWDDLVAWSVEKGLYGLENLSAIPGTVGASPVQNIGAYGVEVSNTIESVRVFDAVRAEFIDLSNVDCTFGYRDSIFKHQKNRYIVTRVVFKLNKAGGINTSYKELADYFKTKKPGSIPSLAEVRQAVIDIRWGKLPDWKLWGTAGSFFKNPIVSIQQCIELRQKYPDLPSFPDKDGTVKIPLGWILDKVCNLKGLCMGNACVYENQALVVVTKRGSSADEVVRLTNEIRKVVREKTSLEIEAEVEWVN